MKYGMNLLLWTGELNDGMLPVLEQLKKMGYYGVEVPIFSGEPSSFRQWAKRLDDLGLQRTAVTIRTDADRQKGVTDSDYSAPVLLGAGRGLRPAPRPQERVAPHPPIGAARSLVDALGVEVRTTNH